MIAVKKFSPDMQRAVGRFLNEVFPESGKVFEPETRHAAFADIERSFIGFWCLLDGDCVIGTVAVKKLGDKACELKGLYVYERFHGRGLGFRLAETAVNFAMDGGFEKMYLDTMSKHEKAVRLYERMGFRRTVRYNDNEKADLFMMKEL